MSRFGSMKVWKGINAAKVLTYIAQMAPPIAGGRLEQGVVLCASERIAPILMIL